MPKKRTDKVVCYVLTRGHLLVFTHEDHPLEETGVQVPAGTIKPGETPEAAALREATEETGPAGLRVVRLLGEADYDISPYRHEVMRRHFVELTCDDADLDRVWASGEPDPEGGIAQPGAATGVDGGQGAATAGPRFRCRWIPLAQAHCLAGGLSQQIGMLVPED